MLINAGPVKGSMFLAVVDAYSKYPEMVKMSSTTSQATIQALWEIFSHYGLPEILNNNKFILIWRIKHTSLCALQTNC